MFHIPRASQVLYKEPATSCSWRVCVSRVTGKQDIRYSSILFDGDRHCFATASPLRKARRDFSIPAREKWFTARRPRFESLLVDGR